MTRARQGQGFPSAVVWLLQYTRRHGADDPERSFSRKETERWCSERHNSFTSGDFLVNAK